MIRVLFSIIFVVLILALGKCAQTAFHSHKAIGRSVALLLIGLIPPVIGNLVIISSTYKLGATIGSYIYFLGMDLAVYALLRFTFDYCAISWPNRALRLLVDALLILDVVQLLLNPVFHHAFDNEAILVGGATYFRLLPYVGQSFHRIVDYGIFAAALIIFFLKALRSPRINSERYSVILAAMVFTGLWQTFYIFSRTPIDRSMIGFGVFGLLVYYLALYYRPMRLLDRMLATIASEMPEALFFFEMNGQCIWANRPALELTGAGDGDFDLAAERLRELMGDCGEGCETWSGQQVVGSGEASKSYVVERRPVTDEGGRQVGSFLSIRDNTHEQRLLQREMYNATHDSLTDLYNRAGYDLYVSGMELDSALMILIDADNFKDVNDNFGHEVGDRVLQKIAAAIRRHFRVDDFVCRFGGDEFVVIIAHFDDTLHDLICSKFALINEDLADTADGLPPVSVSAGIAFGADAADASALFEHADHALYESKHKGRCRFTFFDAAETT